FAENTDDLFVGKTLLHGDVLMWLMKTLLTSGCTNQRGAGHRLCHDELRRKKISALIPPRKGAGYWPGEYADRNRAVANQRMTGSNARWKWTTDYNRRSIAETAMYRVKQLFGGSLTLRDYDGQVAEAMALVRALNKMTKAGMPESVRIA
ncbi:transposase, partial [Escherichia coli]